MNPMHRVWSDGKRNKLTISHGCYWKQYSICDVTLDYIGNYQNTSTADLVNKIKKIMLETALLIFILQVGAAPRKILCALANTLIERKGSHSPMGENLDAFEINISAPKFEGFAENGLDHEDSTGAEYHLYSERTNSDLNNYLNYKGFEIPFKKYFNFQKLYTTQESRLIKSYLTA